MQGERNGSVGGNGTQAGFSRRLVLMVTDYAEVRGTTMFGWEFCILALR